MVFEPLPSGQIPLAIGWFLSGSARSPDWDRPRPARRRGPGLRGDMWNRTT